MSQAWYWDSTWRRVSFEDVGVLGEVAVLGGDVDDGLGLDEAGAGVNLADGCDGGEVGEDELALEGAAGGFAVGVEGLHVAADPGPEGHFIDGAIEGDFFRIFSEDEAGGGGGEGGEGGDEVGGEDVEVVGDAPVAEVPDDLGAGGRGGAEHGGGRKTSRTDWGWLQ